MDTIHLGNKKLLRLLRTGFVSKKYRLEAEHGESVDGALKRFLANTPLGKSFWVSGVTNRIKITVCVDGVLSPNNGPIGGVWIITQRMHLVDNNA